MASNIAIKITTDITEPRANLAILQAQLRATTAEVGNLAKRSLDANIASSLRPQLLQSTEAMVALQRQVAGARKGMGDLEGGMHGAGAAVREFRAAFDELTSGRTRNLPGTLAIIATQVLGLSVPTIAATVAIGALVAGLGLLAVNAISAGNALDSIKIGADFAGNLDLSTAATEKLIEKVSQLPSMSKETAEKVVSGFATMKNAGAPLIEALSLAVQNYAQATGQDADKAAEALKRAFDDPLQSGIKFLNTLPNVTQAQFDAATAATKAGNAHQVQAVMLQGLAAALGSVQPRIQQHNASIWTSIGNYAAWLGWMQAGESPMHAQALLVEDQAKRWKDLAAAIAAAAAAQAKKPEAPTDIVNRGLQAAVDVNPTKKALEDARQKIADINAALVVARKEGSAVDVAKLVEGLSEARKRLADLNRRDNSAAQRAAEEARQAADAVRQIQQQAQLARITSEQRTNDFLLSMGQRSLDEWRAQAQQLANARIDAEEKFYRDKAAIDAKDKKALDQDNAHLAQLAGERAAALLEIDQRYQQQKRQQAQTDLADFIQGERDKLAAGHDAIEQDFDAHRINAQQRHDAEVDLTRTVEAEVLKRLNAEIAGLKQGTQAYADAVKQRDALVAQFGKNYRTTDDALTKDAEQRWHTLASSISGSVGGALQGLVFQGENWQQALGQIISATGTAFIRIGEDILTNWIETSLLQSAAGSTSAQAQILQNANVAGSAAVASTAAIPIIGPEMAPAAGAAAFMEAMAYSIPALSVGTSYVPMDTVAMLHQGEMVMPRFETARFSKAMASMEGGSGDGAPGQGPALPDVHIHLHGDMDPEKVRRVLPMLKREMARVVAETWNDNPSLRPRY
jgi:hypothetical protein